MYEKLSMTKAEFDALPRYDFTLPTGVVAGKRWKYFNSMREPGDQWLVGEYIQTADGAAIYTKWWRPNIRVPARHPHGYRGPCRCRECVANEESENDC